MSSPARAFTSRAALPPASERVTERTVYLRRELQGWSVSLDAALLLVTDHEEQAFQRACAARSSEDGVLLPMLILSGPAAATPGPGFHVKVTIAAE